MLIGGVGMRSFQFFPLLALGWLIGVGLLGLPSQVWAQRFLAGDLDGDGQITDGDLNTLSGYLQGARSLTDQQIEAADIDQDGQITQTDWQLLQQSRQVITTQPNSEVQLDSAYSGRVVDRATGQPLGGVEVAIPEAGVSVVTDRQGRFQLPDQVPSDQILVARLEDYLPYSQTTRQGSQPLEVELERWDQETTLVLESDLVRLGDNAYSPDSAAAGEFRLPAQGRELTRTFDLRQLPFQPPTLRIGSLIGLDTPEAVRAGQSRIPYADMTPMVIQLNGSQVATIALAGDQISVSLPIDRLQIGLNTVTLQTGQTYHDGFNQGQVRIPVNIPVLGGGLRIQVPVGGSQGGGRVDYDDVQLANVVIDLP